MPLSSAKKIKSCPPPCPHPASVFSLITWGEGQLPLGRQRTLTKIIFPPFCWHELSTYCVPSAGPEAWHTSVNKIEGKNLPSWNVHFRGGRTQTTKQKTLQCQVVINALKINTAAERRWGFPGGTRGKEPACQCGRCKRGGFGPWVGKSPWRREWLPTPVVSPMKSHGQRRLTGYSPRGHQELDTTE